MAAITSIPTTRVSDLLIRQRLVAQTQFDQLELFRLQNALSTGRRISIPSDDAPAALRAVNLQRNLERVGQVQENLRTNQSYLSATETSLSGASSALAEIHGNALGLVSTTSSESERNAVILQIDQAVKNFLDIGNKQFRDRFLFAGSETTQQPYSQSNKFVTYSGNERKIQAFADVGTLFDTNVPGDDALGGLSSDVQSTADLNPILTANTRLTALRGGLGISDGSVTVSDGTASQTINISGAETVGDIVSLLQANPPAGRAVTATVTATGINISLDTGGGGNLTITEVGGGTTVNELGILEQVGAGTGPVVGADLNPRATTSTPLSSILGVRASASVPPNGANNNLVVQAVNRGPALNGVTISFVDGGPGTAGSEAAVYNAGAGTLVVTIESGVSTANQVITAITAEGTFSAQLDLAEQGNNGSGTIQDTVTDASATGLTAGGSGIEFDQASGLQIVNGGQTFTVDISTAQTIGELLNILNGSGAGVLAEINTAQNGFDVRSRVSGADFSIGENGGLTATHLGIRSFTTTTTLTDLNFGRGVHNVTGTDFFVQRKDGVQIAVDVTAATTIGDILNQINTPQAGDPAGIRVVAQLAASGNGIELVTTDTAVTAPFQVIRTNSSFAATDLGLVTGINDTSDPPAVAGTTETITGRDTNPHEVDSVFTSLVRLRDSLEANDKLAIERAIGLVDVARSTLNQVRGEIGARQQGLDFLKSRLESEEIQLQETLSLEIDTDLIEAISSFTARQASFEAALRTSGQILQISLLNFL